MTGFVQQRTPHDCAIACMAMLTGRPYDDVMAAVGGAFDPVAGMRREQEALQRRGYAYEFHNGRPVGDMVCWHRPYALSAEFFRDLAWGRRALLSVPSLNNPGGWHMVFHDGVSLFDPSPHKAYARFDDLRPNEIILFREVPK